MSNVGGEALLLHRCGGRLVGFRCPQTGCGQTARGYEQPAPECPGHGLKMVPAPKHAGGGMRRA
jgi:hypothetical protein